MAITLAGQASNTDAVGSGTTLVVTRTTTAGNLLVLSVSWLAGDTTTITIADTATNTWIKASKGDKAGSTGTRTEIWYVINAAAITSLTITQSAASVKSAVLGEFAGIGAGTIGVTNTNTTGGTATPALTNTVAPTAGDLAVASMNLNNTAAITVVTTGSWVAFTPAGTLAGNRAAPAYKLSATSSESESWTFASGTKNWGATIASFTPAAAGITVTPGTASLTLTRFTPTVSLSDNKSVTPGIATLTLTGFTPTVTASDHKLVTPGIGSLTLTGFAPTVSVAAPGAIVTPGTATLTLSAFAPTVTATDHKLVTPGVRALTLATFAPTVTASDHKLVTPGIAALALTAFVPIVTASSPTLTGGQAPSGAAFLASPAGSAPTLTFSGQALAPTPTGQARMVKPS